MDFSGTERFDSDQDVLWRRLTDMEFMSEVIPDRDRVEQIEPDSFVCRVRPGLSFLSGSLKLTFNVVEKDRQNRLTVVVDGKGLGATMKVKIVIHLAQIDLETELAWTGTVVNRTGLLKPISAGLIQAAAQKIIDRFWRSFRAAIATA